MIQIHLSVGRPGYVFNTAGLSTQSGDTLRRSGNPTLQPLKMFQFIIGELRFTFAHLLMNQLMPSLFFQPMTILHLQHPLVPLLPLLP